MCKQLDDYSTGKEIPKVELRVISDNPHEPLDHTIQLTGVMSPHDSIRISRPLQEPPLSESVDDQQERPAEQQKSRAEQQESQADDKQQERPAEQQKIQAEQQERQADDEQQERPAEQQEKPVQHQEKPIQQAKEAKGQQKRPTAGNLGTTIMYL